MKTKAKSHDGTHLIQWFKNQLDIASAEFSASSQLAPAEYLGKHRQPMLADLQLQAKGMSRGGFQKWLNSWFQKLNKTKVESLHYLELHFHYGVELSEVWEIKPCRQYPELTTSVTRKALSLPTDFLRIGGEADWIQEPETLICPDCDGDMAMLLQLSSPSGSEVKACPELESFVHGDGGRLFLMGCQKCAQYSSVWQCY